MFMAVESFDGKSGVLKYTPDLERFYSVFTVPVIVHDDEHRVVSLNRAMSVLLGIDPEGIVGRRCQEVLHILNISSNTCPFLTDDEADCPESCRVRIARSCFLLTRYPVMDENTRPAGGICVFNEIPAAPVLESVSPQRIELLESMLDAQTDFMCWKDSDGRWQYVNQSGRKFFGFEEEDYRGKTDFEIVAGNVLFRAFFSECASIENEAWNTGRAVTSRVKLEMDSHRVSTFEITKIPFFNSDGTRRGIAGIARDVTRSVTAEQEMHSVINQLNIILDNISSAVALIIDRKVIWTNSASERLFGYSAAELQGCTTEKLYLSRQQYEEFGSSIYLELARKGNARGEVQLRRKNGEKVWCLYSTVFVNPEDPSKGIIAALEDIQAQKDAWKREQELQEKMQHAQKLESLGVLAGGIAHDFNNLLMGIMGNAELCLMKFEPDSPLRTYVENIRNASKKAAELTGQMLAYSGKGHFIIEPVNLSMVVHEMSELLDSVISKKARVVFHLDKNLPSVRGDVSQMRQVVMNLLVNASEALEEMPGDIIVSTGVMDVDREYLQMVFFDHEARPGKYVWLEVKDTGTGMDSHTISRIFEPFFTTKFSGRGLGLAALLGIVRGHHGIIRVDSKPDSGTTVRVLFPIYDDMQKSMLERGINGSLPSVEKDSADRPKDAETQPFAFSGIRVMVVDDEKEVRDVARMLLESVGCRVITAINGSEAVELFRREHGSIDAVLLDLTMPDMGSEEVLRQLRSIDPHACVVLSSGYSEEESTEDMGQISVNGFMQKPYAVSELVACLSAALIEKGKGAEN